MNYRIETPLSCTNVGELKIYGTNSASNIAITSGATSANVDFTLPNSTGTVDQYLQRTGATSTGWVTKKPVAANDTIPSTMRFSTGDMPVTPTVISSAVFTALGYFIYGGTSTSRTPTTMSIVFSITPANTIAQLRLGDLTTPTTNITTMNCTNTTTAITFASAAITVASLPAGESVMVFSAAVTTATSISIYSISVQ